MEKFNQPSTMQHSFSRAPKVNIERSVFNRDMSYKTAFNPDYLIPIFAEPMLPGDTLKLKTTILMRMPSALIRPFLDNMRVYTYFFWCPNRLVWSNWMKFQGAQTNPGDSTSFTVPQFTAYNCTAESLSDYFGIPPLAGGATKAHVSLAHRMYNLCWNEHFRDQNLQNSVTVDLGDGPDNIANYVLKKANKGHDYFTSCLPWTQKGTAQTIPLGTQAPIKGLGRNNADNSWTAGPLSVRETDSTGTRDYAYYRYASSPSFLVIEGPAATGNPQIYADLTAATAASINTFRQAMQIQAIYELDARSGTRYAEICEARFGVDFPDILYRPEFLGGDVQPLSVVMVPQSSATNAQPTGLGNVAAFAQGVSPGSIITKSFVEHGWVIGLMCVKADLNYQQGLHRKWTVSTRFDYYEPLLANLGEQSVLNQEIYLQGSANPTNDAAVFGYQERWAHEKYGMNLITGKLRSTYATPLDAWHLAQKFTALPTLGDTFIQETMPWTRIAAVTTEPAFVADVYHDFKHVRPIPVYSIPGVLPRF